MVSRAVLLNVSLRVLLSVALVVAAAQALGAALWATGLVALLAALMATLPLLSAPPPPATNGAARLLEARLDHLEVENGRLRSFLDHTPTPLLVLSGRDRLQAGNKAARRQFAADNLIAEPPPLLLAAIREATPGRLAAVRLPADGVERNYALLVTDLAESEGVVRLAALTDIQAELQAAESAALKDFVHVLSHEIMNSLTPVTSLAQTARQLLEDEDPASAAQAREAVETLARRSEGLLHFVESYRQLARVPDLQPRRVDLARLLEDTARLFRSRWTAQGVELVVEAPTNGPAVQGDPDLLTQALLNLLDNAAQAALAGGRPPRVELAAYSEDGRARLQVRDNGPGVVQPDPQLVFRPFFTTRAGGTGVGLSLVRQIMLAHGAEVTLQPHGGPEGGAVFTLRF